MKYTDPSGYLQVGGYGRAGSASSSGSIYADYFGDGNAHDAVLAAYLQGGGGDIGFGGVNAIGSGTYGDQIPYSRENATTVTFYKGTDANGAKQVFTSQNQAQDFAYGPASNSTIGTFQYTGHKFTLGSGVEAVTASAGDWSGVNSGLTATNLAGGLTSVALNSTVSQSAQYAQRGLNLAHDAEAFAKFAKGAGRLVNGLSYATAGYQLATGQDNTSTWVDVAATSAAIGAEFILGAAFAPEIAVGAALYGIWSVSGGSDWINHNYGYRK